MLLATLVALHSSGCLKFLAMTQPTASNPRQLENPVERKKHYATPFSAKCLLIRHFKLPCHSIWVQNQQPTTDKRNFV